MSAVRLPSYPRGAPVVHPKYGRGVVLAVGDVNAVVAWDNCHDLAPLDVETFLPDLSLDLSSDLGRSIARGWLGERVGIDVSNGVSWGPVRLGGAPLAYALWAHHGLDSDRDPWERRERALFCEPDAFPDAIGIRVPVPGISKCGPADALALALSTPSPQTTPEPRR